ncbi:hypothetical protein EMCRGX_G021728 [Ephydatia muelleri]
MSASFSVAVEPKPKGGTFSLVTTRSAAGSKLAFRFATASNDKTAIVWDSETGHKLCVLSGHEGPVTCVLPLRDDSSAECSSIMTASTDMTIRVWELNSRDSFEGLEEQFCKRVVTEHKGLVNCLVQLNSELVCSGGEDLCLWNKSGELHHIFHRQSVFKDERGPIHSVLKLDNRHFGVVTASHYHRLSLFDINTSVATETNHFSLQFVSYLEECGEEPISCLTSISGNLFASAAHKGGVVLWSTNSLRPVKLFNCTAQQPNRSLLTNIAIKQIQAVGERYLFVTVANGFEVYDVIGQEDAQGRLKPLASHLNAHSCAITYLEFVESRAFLVTAAEDNAVRLWGSPNKPPRDTADVNTSYKASIEDFLGIDLNPKAKKKPLPIVPMLLGEMNLHPKYVTVTRYLGKYGLATAGLDGMMVLWKDGDEERDKRDIQIQRFLTHAGFLSGETA